MISADCNSGDSGEEVRRPQLRNTAWCWGVLARKVLPLGSAHMRGQEELWGGRKRPGPVCDTRSIGRTSVALNLDKG